MAKREIVIVGAGHVGLYAALRMQRRMGPLIRSGRVRITLIDSQSYMTYQPFLPEAAAGSVEPRHVVVPLRRVLPRLRVLAGVVRGCDPSERTVRFTPAGGGERTIGYDVLVMAPGSISRVLPVPGLAEHGIGFKTIEEAVALRNHVLYQLDIAAATEDPELRRQALTFMFVGAGFAGVEAFAELEDMARDVARKEYPGIGAEEMRWILVEATERILPEVGPEMGAWTAERLRARGCEVRLKTMVDKVEADAVTLNDGERVPTSTLVWTAGVKPNPLVRESGLPIDDKGRISATALLTVHDHPEVYTAGDCAAVPDLTKPGEFCAPNAQHAVRQAVRLADNVHAALLGRPQRPYRHAYAGSLASLGLFDGVANVYGVRVKGLPAWALHRVYHLGRVPTFNRKARVTADWALALCFPRDAVSLGTLHDPRHTFEDAAAESGAVR
ncbi:NAD(P)/FAD-dependent oxidoreductase [Allonocardiopsis opalescens]|uniref:NADH dehydrogenase n=1 Tax=Allonocardiopsis opalescens TaxID=1144618 RepID=A0A2T0QAD2_9ACTN|nr:NAD(P)/FAD-dependent oxidoreductase [Allonocardiopsis opalescens]PRY00793.1 NADH dehydrogenase [Allonocardiopsis opalescens]